MYDANGHRIRPNSTPTRGGKYQSRRTPSPSIKATRRMLGATPPPAELDEDSSARWLKYNKILESITRDAEDELAPPRPPLFDYRGVEMIAALAPAFGKYLFLAKAKSFAWWKNSTMKPLNKHNQSPSPKKATPHLTPNGKAPPFRRIKISTKYSERWSVPTVIAEPEASGEFSISKQYDLRQLKKEELDGSPEKMVGGRAASPGDGAGDWGDVDLNTMGLMPDIIYPLFHANETTLWKLFSEYVLGEDNLGLPAVLRSLVMSTSREQKLERMETRLMTFDTLWTVLRDYEVSPDVCSMATLQQSVKFVQFIMGSSRETLLKDCKSAQNTSLGSTWSTVDDAQGFGSSLTSTGRRGLGSTGGSASSLGSPRKALGESHTDPEFDRLSYSEFIKVLWQLSIRCTEKPPHAHPIIHVQKLFRLMDSSDGRNKMGKRHRTASIIPRFIGCSLKDSTTKSSSGGSPHQSNIMQYLRKVMTQAPPPSVLKCNATPIKGDGEGFLPIRRGTSPDGSALMYALNDVIVDKSVSPRKGKLEVLKVEFSNSTDHESSSGSAKSTPHRQREGLFTERRHPKSCPACSEGTRPTPDPLVFG